MNEARRNIQNILIFNAKLRFALSAHLFLGKIKWKTYISVSYLFEDVVKGFLVDRSFHLRVELLCAPVELHLRVDISIEELRQILRGLERSVRPKFLQFRQQ